ncbi:Uncharacterised protein [Klebsiella michiganensis]|nr:Uncharacterised protein [Klebsiella michiganensis]
MITAKEPRWAESGDGCGGFEHAVALAIDYRAFLLRMRTPQQKDDAFPMLVNQRNDFIVKVSQPRLA